MFESLMFWKKKEDPSSSFSSSAASSSFNPLDVQSPPAFGDASMNSGMPSRMPAGQYGSTGFDSQSSMPQYPNGFSDGQSHMGDNGAGVSHDPFANPGQSAPSGFGQSAYGTANPMMQQLQMQNAMASAPAMSTLPSRSVQSDPNAIHPRDVELILSRLELIRSEIENVNHRLTHLEANAAMKPTGSGKNKGWY